MKQAAPVSPQYAGELLMCCFQAALMRFHRWTTVPERPPRAAVPPSKQLLEQKLLPTFRNGRALRDYQVFYQQSRSFSTNLQLFMQSTHRLGDLLQQIGISVQHIPGFLQTHK